MNWLQYLLEANIYMAVFYLLYFLLLNKETHYKWNRAYLLLTSVLAYIIPLIQVSALRALTKEKEVGTLILIPKHNAQLAVDTTQLILQNVLFYAYIIGAMVMLLLLIIKLSRLVRLMLTPGSLTDDSYKLVRIKGSNTAFSFFNYLFLGTQVNGADTVIRHELVHIRQRHSWDILFLEFLKIVSWFNPFIYLVQISIKTVHEYIADEQTAAYESGATNYSSFLVANAYGLSGSSITHSFFNYNLLKKRIIMLHQKRSGSLARLKYLAALPLCAALLCASTLGFSKTYGWVDLAPAKKSTPVASASKIDTTHSITGKGYKYEESGYFVNNKAEYRVIITEKNGEKKSFFKNSATHAELAMLKEKYGYTFPNMNIYPKLPPPPPTPPKFSKVKFPSPASPKVVITDVKLAPPPPPAPPKVDQIKLPKSKIVDQVKYPPGRSPKVDQVKFPPPVVKPDVIVKRPPPPPPAPPKNAKVREITIDEPTTKKVDTVKIKLEAPVVKHD